MELPRLPAPIAQFLTETKSCKNQNDIEKATEPYKIYESKLREIYAQNPQHPATRENHLVPVFTQPQPTIRARNLDNESQTEKDKFLLLLGKEQRRAEGSPAIVASLKEFQTNFSLFSENSLAELDWSNVVAAGSSVLTPLLPVDSPHNESKRARRKYYHEIIAPASDVDLFLYGLDEKQAIEKIKQIEAHVRDALLTETTSIRTKNAITIVSEHPVRHIQIVLRLYKNVSEILTGFDVDCSCVAYDGKQVWASPRALSACITQINTIDLTRRSPSYENRLSKYSHRGFEVYWPTLDRARIDPTIYERSFSGVVGLARLLVLEKLPHPMDRKAYEDQRREERGRPARNNIHDGANLKGNIKDAMPDEVAEWEEESEMSNYHTVRIPYGPRFNIRRISKLLFTKDLLLNAEWNRHKDRETALHRHPAFFGSVSDIIQDCCGYCPEPKTDDDLKVFTEEGRYFIKGDIQFIKDDPGRQAIGSFNPITDADWTEMAYVGNTQRLCRAIVDKDLEAVQDWFDSGELDYVNVNRRDHTGRTPLQLACMCSSLEIVQCLIDHGARLVSRQYNGMTALHIAAAWGDVGIVKAILDQSLLNEAEEGRKEEERRKSRTKDAISANPEEQSEATDLVFSQDMADADSDGNSSTSDEVTEGSFVKLDRKSTKSALSEDPDKDEPDFYDINVVAWDAPVSPLHLAAMRGGAEVIEALVNQWNADVLKPVKINNAYGGNHKALLTLCLPFGLPVNQADRTIATLLQIGATIAQGDDRGNSAFHHAIHHSKNQILKTMVNANQAVARRLVNTIEFQDNWQKLGSTPLGTALITRRVEIVDQILALGANRTIKFEDYAKAYDQKFKPHGQNSDDVRQEYEQNVLQPIVIAAKLQLVEIVHRFLDEGVNVNTLAAGAYRYKREKYYRNDEDAESLLDVVQAQIDKVQGVLDELKMRRPDQFKSDKHYLRGRKGSYEQWSASTSLLQAKEVNEDQLARCHMTGEQQERVARSEKMIKPRTKVFPAAILETRLQKLKELQKRLIKMGAKSFFDLFPEYGKSAKNKDNSASGQPYETRISFGLSDSTGDEGKEYLRLFEAAWTNDIDTVKSLCLSARNPLQITVQDKSGFTPFQLAVLQGHRRLADVIIEIATAQHEPAKQKNRKRYVMGRRHDYDSDYSSDEERDKDQPQVFAEIVNDDFTIDNVIALADSVKSQTSPRDMVAFVAEMWRTVDGISGSRKPKEAFLCGRKYPNYWALRSPAHSWECFGAMYKQERQRCSFSLLRYAILMNDINLLKYLLRTEEALARQDPEEDDPLKMCKVSSNDFIYALRLGRVELIEAVIRHTGVYLPVQQLVTKSGAVVLEKPKYYQGLTVHGKKRNDWVKAARGEGGEAKQNDTIPLLLAAFEGNLSSTQEYLSEKPLEWYEHFANLHKSDQRINGLREAKGGLRASLKSWLTSRNNLALHMAVMSQPTKTGNNPTLEFIIEKMPKAVDSRDVCGRTPLFVAFQLCRLYDVKTLITAGADPTIRAEDGKNILHVLFETFPVLSRSLLASVFALLEDDVIKTLLLQRSKGSSPGGLTPLAVFLQREFTDHEVASQMIRLILSYSNGEDLQIMSSAGEYPLHMLVSKTQNYPLVETLIKNRPTILSLENATGMTPLEVAENRYLRERTDSYHVPVLPTHPNAHHGIARALHHREDRDKWDDHRWEQEELRDQPDLAMCWKLRELESQFPNKRQLVSIHDANEVAKRLAYQQQKKNEEAVRRSKTGVVTNYYDHEQSSEENATKDEKTDEVVQRMTEAQGFRKWDLATWATKLIEKEGKLTRDMELDIQNLCVKIDDDTGMTDWVDAINEMDELDVHELSVLADEISRGTKRRFPSSSLGDDSERERKT